MNTESNQSSGNRYQDSSPEEEAQRTGAFGWGEAAGPVPPWSVPPGLIVPGPRSPYAGTSGDEGFRDDLNQGDPDPDPGNQRSPDEDPEDEHGKWPGVAAPAGWFLRHQETPTAANLEGPAPEASDAAADTGTGPAGSWPSAESWPSADAWHIKGAP